MKIKFSFPIFFIFAFVLTELSVSNQSFAQQANNCAVFVMSDIHLYSNDFDDKGTVPDEQRSLSYAIYKKSLANMREKMRDSLLQNKTPVDCISIVVNGDPYNRDEELIDGKPVNPLRARPGFEKQTIQRREELIKLVAEDIQNELKKGMDCSDKNKKLTPFGGETLENILDCKDSDPRLKDKEFKLFFASNVGDHEIPKLLGVKDMNEANNMVLELPTLCQERVKKNMLSFVPTANTIDNIKKFNDILKEECGIVLNPAKNSYKWMNGDDVQAINSIGGKIADSWRQSGYHTLPVDPRVGHLLTMPDGRSYIFSHVDKVASPYDDQAVKNQHDKQGHQRFLTGSMFKGFPEGDPRNDPMNANLTTFTGDSHVALLSLALAFKSANPEIYRYLKKMTGSTNRINPGSFSASLRAADGLNGYAALIPNQVPEIRSLSVGDGSQDAMEYSKKNTKAWIDAGFNKDPGARLAIEEKMRTDIASPYTKEISVNPLQMHNEKFYKKVIETFNKSNGDPTSLLRLFHDKGYDTTTSMLEKIKTIISCDKPNRNVGRPD